MTIIGQTIVALRPATRGEMDAEGWDSDWDAPPTVIELDNGILLYPSRDPEGNGPGTMFGMDGTESFSLETTSVPR